MNKFLQIPRVVSEYPLNVTLSADSPVPVRMRDDLDPCSPPAEYADGKISWSGYASRALRDSARITQAEQSQQDAAREAQYKATMRCEREAELRREAWLRLETCTHASTVERNERGFSGAVSADENRAAHGNICVDEYCCRCRCSRSVNVNQNFREKGDWAPDEKEIKAAL